MKITKLVGVALCIGWATLCHAGFAQSLGEECPLAQKGRPCADDSICMEASCSGPDGTTKRAYCELMGDVCAPDKKYMDPCGTNGRCFAQTTEFGGLEPNGENSWCRISAYVCSEAPPFVDWDASPDARAAQLRKACPTCPPPAPGPAPDGGVAPSVENEGARTSSSDESSGCMTAAAGRVGSGMEMSTMFLAVVACRLLRRSRRLGH
jgi:hypothetical protein